MYSLRHPYSIKIGISDTPKRRRNEIEASIRERVGPIRLRLFPPFPMLFSRFFERTIHKFFRRFGLNEDWAGGSDGATEWVAGANFITAAAIWYFTDNLGYCAAALAVPIVWDAWLLIFAIFVIDIALFWLGVWVVYNYFF